jgi:hypothetical protein
MGINCRLEDERGEQIAVLIEPISGLLSCVDLSKTVCLRFIDHYGNTIFNKYQMVELIAELKTAREQLNEQSVSRVYETWLQKLQSFKDPAIGEYALKYPRPNAAQLRSLVDAVIELATEGSHRRHVYLKFIGD